MIRHLTAVIVGLVLSIAVLAWLTGNVAAGDRYPVIYNANSKTALLSASFFAGGVNQSIPTASKIAWSQANGTPGVTFQLAVTTDHKSCEVTTNIYTACQVDVTCSYTNADGTQASQTITVCFAQAPVDHVAITASG